jgi:hypothetical protein
MGLRSITLSGTPWPAGQSRWRRSGAACLVLVAPMAPVQFFTHSAVGMGLMGLWRPVHVRPLASKDWFAVPVSHLGSHQGAGERPAALTSTALDLISSRM